MLSFQIYKGRTYKLYPHSKYFTSHTFKLHREVWKDSYGNIPEGYEIHHIDNDTGNNDISNLELKKVALHRSEHIKKRIENKPEWFADFQTKGIEAAKVWHKSAAGHKWHIQQAAKQGLGKDDYGTSKCPICSKEFKKTNSHHRFCHPNCKAKDFRKRHKH